MMSIECLSAHGENSFCHCAISYPGDVPLQPIDSNWQSLNAPNLTALVQSMLNLASADGKMTLGTFSNGGLESGISPSLQHSIYLSLRDLGETRIRTALVIESSVSLDVLNVLADTYTADCWIWTAGRWLLLRDDESSKERMIGSAVNGKYYYRILLSGAQIRALTMTASQEFRVMFYQAPVIVERKAMNVAAQSPALHVQLSKTMNDYDFPDGVRLHVQVDSGVQFQTETFNSELYVKRHGQSLHAMVLLAPPSGQYRIEVIGIQGIGFHVVFQTTPHTDVMPTMRKTLEPLYAPSLLRDAGLSESTACMLCKIAVGVIAGTSILIGVGALVVTGGTAAPFVVSIFAALGLTVTKALLVALVGLTATEFIGGLCYLAGVCDVDESLRRIIDKARNHEQRYDQMCYLTTHNAFSYRTLITPLSAQQSMTIAQQLDRGVDALMLDIWLYSPKGNQDIYLCHENCNSWVQWVVGSLDGPRRLVDELKLVIDALKREPDRIITLFLEAYLHELGLDERITKLHQVFDAAGAVEFMFHADRDNVSAKGNTWNVNESGWPTRKWMIDNNLRLVVFSDHHVGHGIGFIEDGISHVWDYVAETEFGNPSMDLTRIPTNRGGSVPLASRIEGLPNMPLLLMNYFPTFALGSFSSARFETWNSYDRISQKAQDVARVANRLPNFIAVDYFQIGNNGGPVKVWQEQNRAWFEQWSQT